MLLGKLLLTEIINQMIYLGATCWDQFLFKLGQGTLLARPHRKCLGVLLQARAGAPPCIPHSSREQAWKACKWWHCCEETSSTEFICFSWGKTRFL